MEKTDQGNLIPLITTYSSNSKNFNNKFKMNFQQIIGPSTQFPSSKVISAYKRNKNLSDLLVRAKLPSLKRSKPQLLDSQFINLKFIKNIMNKRIIKIDQRFSPKSKNCIYVIDCKHCGKKYVGETKNTLSIRMTQHRYNIKNHKELETPLVKHFIEHGIQKMRIGGLQRNINWTDFERKKMERLDIFVGDKGTPWTKFKIILTHFS